MPATNIRLDLGYISLANTTCFEWLRGWVYTDVLQSNRLGIGTDLHVLSSLDMCPVLARGRHAYVSNQPSLPMYPDSICYGERIHILSSWTHRYHCFCLASSPYPLYHRLLQINPSQRPSKTSTGRWYAPVTLLSLYCFGVEASRIF